MGMICLLFLAFTPNISGQVRNAKQTTKQAATPKQDCKPTFTPQIVRNALRGRTLKEIPSTDASGDSEWIFTPKELIEVDVIETNYNADGKQATVIAQIKSGEQPGKVDFDAENNALEAGMIEGRLRLTFEIVASELTLIKVENLTVKSYLAAPEVVKQEADQN